MTSFDDAFERDLALALAADAPQPRPGFKEELRERVDEGFPRERRFSLPAMPSVSLPSRKKLMPALAVATCAVVALSVIGLQGDEPGTDGNTGGSGGAVQENSTTREREAPPSVDQAAPGRAAPNSVVPSPVPPSGDQEEFRPGREQRIERSARLSLQVPENRLERTGQRIVDTTERYRGFVTNSSLGSGEDEGSGSYELRIPAGDLRDALRDLGRLGTVRSQSQDGRDVTSGYVSATDRLQTARAQRRSLLRRLERSGTDTEAESLRRQLELNAQQVSGLRSQLRALRARTDYATVNVFLSSRDQDDGAAAPGDDGLGKAFDDAVGSLEDSVEMLVRALGVIIPIGVLALLAWLSARTVRRRRREAALS